MATKMQLKIRSLARPFSRDGRAIRDLQDMRLLEGGNYDPLLTVRRGVDVAILGGLVLPYRLMGSIGQEKNKKSTER